jgi:hypothetical protein
MTSGQGKQGKKINTVSEVRLRTKLYDLRDDFTTDGTYPWSFVTQIFHSG